MLLLLLLLFYYSCTLYSRYIAIFTGHAQPYGLVSGGLGALLLLLEAMYGLARFWIRILFGFLESPGIVD